VPEFDGQKIHLLRFNTALKLIYRTKGPYEEIAIEVINSKIVGTTLYKVNDETSIADMINKLETIIVGETSQYVKAKLAAVQKKGKTVTQFTTEIDHLRKQLEVSFIHEGIPADQAEKLSTKEANDVMIKRAEHKSGLETETCYTMYTAINLTELHPN